MQNNIILTKPGKCIPKRSRNLFKDPMEYRSLESRVLCAIQNIALEEKLLKIRIEDGVEIIKWRYMASAKYSKEDVEAVARNVLIGLKDDEAFVKSAIYSVILHNHKPPRKWKEGFPNRESRIGMLAHYIKNPVLGYLNQDIIKHVITETIDKLQFLGKFTDKEIMKWEKYFVHLRKAIGTLRQEFEGKGFSGRIARIRKKRAYKNFEHGFLHIGRELIDEITEDQLRLYMAVLAHPDEGKDYWPDIS